MRSHFHKHQSKKFEERRKLHSALFVLLVIVAVGSSAFAIVRFINLDWFTIDSVKVVGADSEIAPAIEAAALNAMQGTYLGIVPRSSALVYPRGSVISAVKAASARLSSVAAARDGMHGLKVTVEEKKPAAVVCASLPDFNGTTLTFSDSDTCYFADDSGYVFEEAPLFSGSAYKRIYAPDAGTATTSGSIVGLYATSTDKFTQLITLYDAVNAVGIHVEAILIKEKGEYELYARNPSGQNASGSAAASSTTSRSESNSDTVVIYFNDARPFSEQLINLASFWKDMVAKARSKHQSLSFDYIDARYGSNVFYRTN